jgi:hypothetical protein
MMVSDKSRLGRKSLWSNFTKIHTGAGKKKEEHFSSGNPDNKQTSKRVIGAADPDPGSEGWDKHLGSDFLELSNNFLVKNT